jgi:Bacterial PH domain
VITTTYRSTPMAVLFATAGLWVGALMLFILAFGEPRGQDAVELAVGCVLSVWAILRLSRCGIFADQDGIRVVNPVSTKCLRWEEIRRFVLVDRGACRVERLDGSAVSIFGIQQPAWARARRAGRSQEARMIDELNRRLAER